MADYTSKSLVSKLSGVAEANIESTWLTWATDEIETATGESYFIATSETLKIDGPGGGTLILPKYPIITITKIVCDGVEWTGSAITDTFAIYEDEGIIKVREGLNLDIIGLDEVFAKGTQNIEITGTFGYAGVPAIITELATLLVIKTMMDNNLISKSVIQESIGDYSIRYKESQGDIDSAIERLYSLIIKDEIIGEAI